VPTAQQFSKAETTQSSVFRNIGAELLI